jgi:hypothetical protein
MFEDALKTSGYEGQFIVRELIELINECIDYPQPETEVLNVAAMLPELTFAAESPPAQAAH